MLRKNLESFLKNLEAHYDYIVFISKQFKLDEYFQDAQTLVKNNLILFQYWLILLIPFWFGLDSYLRGLIVFCFQTSFSVRKFE